MKINLKCRQRVERMKANLVGFKACNGLYGPSESHLALTIITENILIIHIIRVSNREVAKLNQKKREKSNQVLAMAENLASSVCFKEEGAECLFLLLS